MRNICSVDGCNDFVDTKGLCKTHYNRALRRGMFPDKGKCLIDGCPRNAAYNGYCSRHYDQMRIKGKAFGDPAHSYSDPNEFIFETDFCKIVLRDVNGFFVAHTIIDIEDVEKVKRYKWRYGKGYAVTDVHKKEKWLHHFIIGIPQEGFQVDHINRNKLDNRRSNLRFASSSQNQANRSLSSNNTSGFKGVYYDRRCKKWCSKVGYNNKEKRLGYFDAIEDAVETYDKTALELHGEYACTNEMLYS
jgi:hypothetical protein